MSTLPRHASCIYVQGTLCKGPCGRQAARGLAPKCVGRKDSRPKAAGRGVRGHTGQVRGRASCQQVAQDVQLQPRALQLPEAGLSIGGRLWDRQLHRPSLHPPASAHTWPPPTRSPSLMLPTRLPPFTSPGLVASTLSPLSYSLAPHQGCSQVPKPVEGRRWPTFNEAALFQLPGKLPSPSFPERHKSKERGCAGSESLPSFPPSLPARLPPFHFCLIPPLVPSCMSARRAGRGEAHRGGAAGGATRRRRRGRGAPPQEAARGSASADPR